MLCVNVVVGYVGFTVDQDVVAKKIAPVLPRTEPWLSNQNEPWRKNRIFQQM